MTEQRRLLPQRLETDAESVERDLFKLVLTIIELVRQLMEKQALRRVDEGDLTDEQVEGLGNGLMHLEQATHWVQHEEPETVNRLLIEFLRDRPGLSMSSSG